MTSFFLRSFSEQEANPSGGPIPRSLEGFLELEPDHGRKAPRLESTSQSRGVVGTEVQKADELGHEQSRNGPFDPFHGAARADLTRFGDTQIETDPAAGEERPEEPRAPRAQTHLEAGHARFCHLYQRRADAV